ncbi:MAG: ABC transporter ATP-binding protein [Eggerthellaceae bacterium]|nr:ABC transporter ATP-binding protein [Eggerthellaceae bacterium]
MPYAVKTEELTKRYADFKLGPITLEVPTGTVLGIVGANGAGKSTLIKCLLGLVAPDGGSLSVLEHEVSAPRDMTASLKERIGVVLDTCAFVPDMRVADIAQLGRAAYAAWDQPCFDELVSAFSLAEKKRVKDLSRGMGMKLSLAFALAHHPELLILDEATAGLDPLARDEVLDMLRTFMDDERHTILLASHITSDLEKLSDRIICLDAGSVIFDEAKDAITNTAGVAQLREADVALLAESPQSEGVLLLREAYHTKALVPDRFAFARTFPNVPVTPASVDEYLAFRLKGEAL